MHLETIADIKRGDKLEVGDFIGTVGDTGNAPDGVYHLHLEIRKDRTPTDPYPRLTETFTIREKIAFLRDILEEVDDEDEYAAFLVDAFPDFFKSALEGGYSLPLEVREVIEDSDISREVDLKDQLSELIDRIPGVLQMTLDQGDQGAAVRLLQIYISFKSSGPAHKKLVAAGATGYYGPATAAAIYELQQKEGIAPTGVYDSNTRAVLGSR